MYEFKPKGTCSSKIRFEIIDDKLHRLSFENGCDGNLKAIGVLAEGMETGELVKKLKGLQCGKRGTSCADQLAQAVEKARKERADGKGGG
ncbi:MAG: TIGR03905 family TSCPD domain-containing protein [Treponema sp.]|jgi:uncharacterized protein (TIGR03905 family)|nr:TIGR03905 family TSCPD domain-containing protein [Treponema sp.]